MSCRRSGSVECKEMKEAKDMLFYNSRKPEEEDLVLTVQLLSLVLVFNISRLHLGVLKKIEGSCSSCS